MDFGLARQLVPSGGMESEEETKTALTSDGSTAGTLAYMSPEQLRGQAADARRDIWALVDLRNPPAAPGGHPYEIRTVHLGLKQSGTIVP